MNIAYYVIGLITGGVAGMLFCSFIHERKKPPKRNRIGFDACNYYSAKEKVTLERE